mmetsp:Transcript_51085/g.115072  ORF Transcript_51085/g.115072 Transcript_51085/m.115072 type:complete len:204 (-) Transcript_51085:109-720(-)
MQNTLRVHVCDSICELYKHPPSNILRHCSLLHNIIRKLSAVGKIHDKNLVVGQLLPSSRPHLIPVDVTNTNLFDDMWMITKKPANLCLGINICNPVCAISIQNPSPRWKNLDSDTFICTSQSAAIHCALRAHTQHNITLDLIQLSIDNHCSDGAGCISCPARSSAEPPILPFTSATCHTQGDCSETSFGKTRSGLQEPWIEGS